MDESNGMNPADAEEYTQALEQSLSGGWRQTHLAVKLGVPQSLGLTVSEWQQRLGGYIKLSVPERREAVKELTDEGLSSRQAADVLGVDHKTVVNDRHAGEDSPPELEPEPEPQLELAEVPEAGEDSPPEPITEEEHEEQISLVDDLDEQGRLARARLVRAYTQALHHVTKELLPLDQGAIADVLEEPMRDQALEFARQVEDWVTRFQRSLQPLRVVKGDQR